MDFKKSILFILIQFVIFCSFITVCFAKNVTLTWDEHSDPNIAGYKIFYKSASGGVPYDGIDAMEGDSPVDVGNVTTATLTGLSETEDYYFTATAYNHEGLESDYSNEVALSSEPQNQSPIANAGPEQTVDEGSTVTLNGRNSSDPENGTLTYQWEQTGGTAVMIINPGAAETTFIAPMVGTDGEVLSFRLTVTDAGELSASDDCFVNISWINEPPSADAGPDLNVSKNDVVTLDASSSSDLDDGCATYLWEQTDGVALSLSNPDSIQTDFDAPDLGEEGGSLSFLLTVTDHGGLKSTDTCVVNVVGWVNLPPSADVGPNQEVNSGENVTLDGSYSTDPDDGIATYSWAQRAGTPVTLGDPRAVRTSFVAPDTESDGETLTFELTVTDLGNLKSTDTSNVVVSPVLQISSPTDLWASYLTVELEKSGRKKYLATAYVTIVDGNLDYVEGATVTGYWTLDGRSLNTTSGLTGSDGAAKLKSRRALARSGSVFSITLTDVAKEGYSYDPTSNFKTTETATVP